MGRIRVFGEPIALREEAFTLFEALFHRASGGNNGDALHLYQVLTGVVRVMKTVILARGRGTRAYPYTEYLPKSMKILQLMDCEDLELVILNQTQGEIYDQYLSAAKTRAMLDWKPQYSIDEALLETIEWYQGYFAGVAATQSTSAGN